MIANPPRIYAIADAVSVGSVRLADAVREMADAGLRWIQLRAKRVADDELWRLAEDCCEVLADSPVALWMDDRADVAALLPFRGLHLGQNDLPPSAARETIGPRLWVGRSAHNAAQVKEADLDPDVDLVAYGPVFPTASKAQADPEVGLRGLREARSLTRKPLVAIGGIDATTVLQVLATGADSVAMIGAICNGNIAANCRHLQQVVAGRANG